MEMEDDLVNQIETEKNYDEYNQNNKLVNDISYSYYIKNLNNNNSNNTLLANNNSTNNNESISYNNKNQTIDNSNAQKRRYNSQLTNPNLRVELFKRNIDSIDSTQFASIPFRSVFSNAFIAFSPKKSLTQ